MGTEKDVKILPIASLVAALTFASCDVALAIERTAESAKLSSPIPGAENSDESEMNLEISTKPIKIILPTMTFNVPRNYFGPYGVGEPDVSKANRFGFYMFLPDYQGFTKETAKYYGAWYDVRYDFIEVRNVVPNPARSIVQNGKRVGLYPGAWGDVDAQFKAVISSGYELIETHDGLQCYGLKKWLETKHGAQTAICKGVRSNGEPIFMTAQIEPEIPSYGYACNVRYYSEEHRILVEYVFSRRHIDRWREIDNAVWAKLNAWRVK